MFFFSPDLRISDAEREAAADFLKRHYAVGRLTEEELSARVDGVYRARTESQLEALTDDLPDVYEPERRRLPQLGPAAMGAVAVVGAVMVAAALPADVWGPLVAMGLSMVMMLAFTVAPIAIPLLAFFWFARMLAGPPRHRSQRALPPHRPGGWVSVWELDRGAGRPRARRVR